MNTYHQPIEVTDNDIALFVGKNSDYYLRKWELMDKENKKSKWNWAAFLLPLQWMTYRKMYLYSWLWFGIVSIETLFEILLRIQDVFTNIVGSIIAIIYALYGNAWYKKHALKSILEIKMRVSDADKQKEEIIHAGGTNITAVIGITICFLVIMLVLFVLKARILDYQ
jgi:hypothetical protein